MQIIICDDERDALEKYTELIKGIFFKNKIKVEIKWVSGREGLFFALGNDPNDIDLIVMEVHLKEAQDGIDLCRELRDRSYENDIIFLTGDAAKVFDCFEVEPLHFFVKEDLNVEKLERALLKAVQKAKKRATEMITLTCAGESRHIDIGQIDYFEVEKRIIIVHYGEESFEFYSTLGKIEQVLQRKGFIRVHRAFLVNQSKIAGLKGNELTLQNGERIPVGKTYKKQIRLNEWG